MKKNLRYFIALLLGLAVSLSMMGVWGVFGGKLDKVDAMRRVCDAFFISGTLLACSGALVWLSKQGTFNGLSFSIKQVFDIHKIRRDEWKPKETFADYKQRVAEKVKNREFLFLVISGSFYLLLAILFLILYHTI